MGNPVFACTKSADEWQGTLVKELMPVIDRYLGDNSKRLHITVEVEDAHTLAQYIDAAMHADPPLGARTKEFQAVWTSIVHHSLQDSGVRFYWKEAEQLLGVSRLESKYMKVLNSPRYESVLSGVLAIMPD